ncbi:MAG: hypothetical protein H6765_00745 [Candidatus Peribacteria bacterium]|nr:MAG: hypothetical protein H6765_00745 [Candidatus Peribacteria bacterium]
MVFTSMIGVVLARLLGYDWTTALFIAVGLTFSSTIVIVKLISDRGDTGTTYGKISL